MTLRAFAAVDIGGTKIATARVVDSGELAGDGPRTEVSSRAVRPTPTGGASAIIGAVAAAVAELVAETGPVTAVGVGAPGVVDAVSGRVVAATSVVPGWTGAEVGRELERALGLPVAVDNDVRVMARGELLRGAGRGVDDLLFVSLGTGVGGGLARDGVMISGRHGSGGEIGHLLVPVHGAIPCGCGRTDHLEAVAAGPAIAARYTERTGIPQVDLRAVVARLHDGDPVAAEVVTEAATILGRAVAGLVNAIDVQRVVVGGGVAQIGAPVFEPLAAAMRAELLAPLRDVVPVPARLGTDAPLVGAALLAADHTADDARPGHRGPTRRATRQQTQEVTP